MGRTQVFKWFSKLKSGVTTVEDAQNVKRISTSKRDENVDPVKELPFEVIKISILDVVNMLGISFGSVQSILTYLPMYCLAFTFFHICTLPAELGAEEESCH